MYSIIHANEQVLQCQTELLIQQKHIQQEQGELKRYLKKSSNQLFPLGSDTLSLGSDSHRLDFCYPSLSYKQKCLDAMLQLFKQEFCYIRLRR